jgi:Putative metal-binding motif
MSSIGRLWIVAALGISALLAPGAAAAQDCSELGVGELGFPLVEHSCFHASNGPFSRVTATPGATPNAGTVNVDAVHTHYAVAMAPGQVNVVVYTPVRSGTWAIFTETAMPLQVIGEDGQALAVRLSHAVADCPALPLVRVYTLVANQRYTLRLGSAASTATVTPLVLEKISDFETLHGRDRDGDGFGGQAETLSTPCVPPAGFVRSVSDCDDDDPLVHPEADEVCDGSDDNCNGLGDEGACQVGGGGCQATLAGVEGQERGSGSALPLALLGGYLLAGVVGRRGMGRRAR